MVFGWTYFIAIQAIVLLVYFRKRNDKEPFIFSKLFPTKRHFIIFNLALFGLCFFYNSDRQLFCNPVPWAAICLLLFCSAFLYLPFSDKRKKVTFILAPLCGLGLFIAVYLLFFARWEYLIFLGFNIPLILIFHFTIRFLNRKYQTNVFYAFYFYPAAVLTPFLLLYELLLALKSLTPKQRTFFIITPIFALLIMISFALRINYLVNEIHLNEKNIPKVEELAGNPIDGYLMELILGAHWKYHTQLCLLDGWRPPFHDPVLVFANKVLNPFVRFDQGTSLPNAVKLYKKMYPKNKSGFQCKCARHERLLFDLD